MRMGGFGCGDRTIGLVLVSASQFASLCATPHVFGDAAGVVELSACDVGLDAGALPVPPGVTNHSRQAYPGGLGAALDGSDLGVGQRARAAAFAGQPQGHGDPQFDLARAIVAHEAIGLVAGFERRRFGGPGVCGPPPGLCRFATSLQCNGLGLARPGRFEEFLQAGCAGR